jgi:hypothetical protein
MSGGAGAAGQVANATHECESAVSSIRSAFCSRIKIRWSVWYWAAAARPSVFLPTMLTRSARETHRNHVAHVGILCLAKCTNAISSGSGASQNAPSLTSTPTFVG